MPNERISSTELDGVVMAVRAVVRTGENKASEATHSWFTFHGADITRANVGAVEEKGFERDAAQSTDGVARSRTRAMQMQLMSESLSPSAFYNSCAAHLRPPREPQCPFTHPLCKRLRPLRRQGERTAP